MANLEPRPRGPRHRPSTQRTDDRAVEILWFSNETPSRDGQGGQRRQFFQIEALMRDGHHVCVVTLAGPQDDSSIREITEVHRVSFWVRGVPIRLSEMVHAARLATRRQWAGVVIAHSESWPVGRRLARLANAPAFVDLHNVYSSWFRARGDAVTAAHYESLETDILRHADVVSVCAAREINNLPTQAGANLVVMQHGVDESEWSIEPDPNPVPVVKMFGNWDWAPNKAGLNWFLDDVWPRLHALAPQATCEIAGTCDHPRDAPEGVTFRGRVPSVPDFLHDATCVAVPVQGGVGAPVKYAEALTSGVPVVATPEAAHGLNIAGGLISDSGSEWAEWISNLHSNRNGPARSAAAALRRRCLQERSWYATSRELREWAKGTVDCSGLSTVSL